MSLSQNIAAARRKKGLTQEELADLTSVTVRTIQRIEAGQTTPRSYTVKALATALDTTFEELMSMEDKVPQPTEPIAHTKVTNGNNEAVHFMQLLCLSCFTYLVLPMIHFLIPLYILNKKKELYPQAIPFARTIIKGQIYWVISLNLLLLLTAAYNLFCSIYLSKNYMINFTVPVFVLYFINAFVIAFNYTLVRKRTAA